jgi:Bacterial regulatory proteins, tetR family.
MVNPMASRRAASAEETRLQIVEAARRLFVAQGYVATTIDAIADEAGVAVQTIYNAIGSKAAVLSRVLDVTIAGDHEDRSVLERVRDRLDPATADPRAIIRDLARTATDIASRIGDVWHVVESAAAVDPDLAALVAKNDAGRLAGYTFAARLLKDHGALRPGLTVDGAAAIVWSLAGVRTYHAFVTERGWSSDRYRRWLEDALAAALLRS